MTVSANAFNTASIYDDAGLPSATRLIRRLHWRAVDDINALLAAGLSLDQVSETFASLMIGYTERFNSAVKSERPLESLQNLATEIGKNLALHMHALTEADAQILRPIHDDWAIRIQQNGYYTDRHSGPYFFGNEVRRSFNETLNLMKKDNRLLGSCDKEQAKQHILNIMEALDGIDYTTSRQIDNMMHGM
jgi:hypothetical protein